jgi:homoserine kinase
MTSKPTTFAHQAVRVPATSANLGPGFDSLGVAVSLYLRARTVGRQAGSHLVVTRGEGSGEVPTGADNLLWRSFVAGCEAFEVPVPDVVIEVDNDIPLERGLGSSSSAIVAGLALARACTAAVIGDLELVRIATDIEGHPDNVAPAILGGFVAAATADDGTLVTRSRPPSANRRPVVFVPEHRQNTVAARGVLPESLTRAEVAEHGARIAMVVGGMTGAWPLHPGTVGDRLHEPARLQVMGPSGALVHELRGRGIAAWLSGAGPTVAASVARDQSVLDGFKAAEGFTRIELDWDLAGTVTCGTDRCALSGMRGCVGCPWG